MFDTFKEFEQQLLNDKILIDYDEYEGNYNKRTHTIIVKVVTGGMEGGSWKSGEAFEAIIPDKNQKTIYKLINDIVLKYYPRMPYETYYKLTKTCVKLEEDYERGYYGNYEDLEIQTCDLEEIYKCFETI